MRRLGGRYALVELVGTGGMAVVWRGRDEVLGRTVAVKTLAAELAADRRWRQRARAEAQAAARLNHPNIAGVYDYGEAREGPGRRVPFLVMEFVDGQTLAARLAASGALDGADAVRLCAEVASALAAAHAGGVVHRDVKPGNVMLCSRGVKVVDFGVAAVIGQGPSDASGQLLGTPAYIAPEQLRGGAAAPAGDVYGLGLLLYECLTGRRAWDGAAAAQVLTRRATEPDPRLPPMPGLPDPVVDLCRRCLSTLPADRPTSAEAARALHQAAGVWPSARAGMPRSAAAAVPAPADVPTPVDVGAPSTRARLRRQSARAVALATAAASTVAALLATQLPGMRSADDADAVPRGRAELPGPRAECVARYTERRGVDGAFAAQLAVTNTGQNAEPDWSLTFVLPAGQRLTRASGAGWSQRRRTVTLTPANRLAPGATVRLSLQGTGAAGRVGADRPGGPEAFLLDGVACERAITHVRALPTSPRRTRGADDQPAGTRSPAPTSAPSLPPDTTPSPSPSARGPSPTPEPAPTTDPSPTPDPDPPTGSPEPSPSPTDPLPTTTPSPTASPVPGTPDPVPPSPVLRSLASATPEGTPDAGRLSRTARGT